LPVLNEQQSSDDVPEEELVFVTLKLRYLFQFSIGYIGEIKFGSTGEGLLKQ